LTGDPLIPARRGGSGGQLETVPRGEEVGEGPDPTGRRRVAGNGPTVTLVSGTHAGGAKQGRGGD
jgi:hypothetical protein